MQHHVSLRGFVLGVLAGLVIGSVGVAAANIGMKGWQRVSYDFKVGYVTGYLDMAHLARNAQPGGFIDSKYAFVPEANPVEYVGVIDRIYNEPDHEEYDLHSSMQLACHRLQEKYGKAKSPEERAMMRQRAILEVIRKGRESGTGNADASNADAAKAPPAAKYTAPLKPAVKSPQVKHPPKPRKWCRCDGKDPKAARAARRAAAAEKAGEQKEPPKAP